MPPDRVASSRDSRLGFGRIALLLGLLTASFDIFLVLNVGGFTLRIHQVLLSISLAAVFQVTYKDEKLRAPLGFGWVTIWTLFILAFIPNTEYLPRSIGYGFFLLLSLLIVYCTVQLYGNRRWIKVLLKGYLWVFVLVGGFGLLQLLLGAARLPAPLIKQWLIQGVWPRINGFSYEPSYFSTYMLMGWVFSAWLVEHRTYCFGERLTKVAFYVSTLAMLLSTSRIGWATMLLWSMFFLFRRLRFPGPIRFSPMLVVVALCAVVMTVLWIVHSGDKLKDDLVTFAGGTGLFGAPAHSVVDRQNSFNNTLAIISKSPFIGYSLGGVATAIGVMQSGSIANNVDAKHNEGSNVFAEVLAASGVIGVVPFLVYLGMLVRKPLVVARNAGGDTAIVLSGLVWALLMELLILQFNQNILRAYLWFHIGVLSAAHAAIATEGWRVMPDWKKLNASTETPNGPIMFTITD
ncbi:MAG: O-antigen ligase family protein [Steroidobacteraceae bacterium]